MIQDSNILIYVVDPAYEQLRDYIDKQERQLYVSLISKLEVLGYHRLKLVDKIEIEQLLTTALLLPITDKVISEAIRLRQQRKRSLGDSIIAATALLYDQPILTNNIGDFEDIAGLQVISLASVR